MATKANPLLISDLAGHRAKELIASERGIKMFVEIDLHADGSSTTSFAVYYGKEFVGRHQRYDAAIVEFNQKVSTIQVWQ